MIKQILLAGSIALTASCSTAMIDNSNSDLPIFYQAYANFEYVSDINQYRVIDYWDIKDTSKHFIGDCDEFAFSLQAKIGGNVWYVILNDWLNSKHAILVKNGLIYDNMHDSPIYLDDLDAQFIGILEYKSHKLIIQDIKREYKN